MPVELPAPRLPAQEHRLALLRPVASGRDSGPDPRSAPSQDLPPQQNLWVRSGSRSRPRLCKRANFATFAVRNPYDFFVTSFTLLLSPSTAPDEICLGPGTSSG